MSESSKFRTIWSAIDERLDYRRNPMFATVLSLTALVLGLALGTAAHGTQNHSVKALLDFSRPIGMIWLNGLQMIILPFVISHLIVAVCGSGSSRAAGRMAGLSMTWFVVMLAVTTGFTVAAGSTILHFFPSDPAARDAIRATAGKLPKDGALRLDSSSTMGNWVANLVPSNLLKAGADSEFLPIVIATVLFAMAARQAKPENLAALLSFARAIAETTLVLAGWLLRLLPLAVLSLTLDASAKAGSVVASGIGLYIVTTSSLLLLLTLALYPITWGFGGVSIRRFSSAMLATQAIAISTRSSLASLPSLLDGAQKRLDIPEAVAAFVLPLAVAVFRLSRAVSGPMCVIFLAHLYGLHIGAATMIAFSIIAICLSFGTPGLPSGGALLFMPLYLSMGLPLAGIILINAADAVTDLFKTMLNVTASMSVAAIVARAESTVLDQGAVISKMVPGALTSVAGAGQV